MDRFKKIFGRTSAVVIGMVHVEPLPGTPRNTHTIEQIVENALQEVKLYLEAGVVSIRTVTEPFSYYSQFIIIY
jgi:hypothetical protein